MVESHHSWKEWSGKKDEILLNHSTCWHKERSVEKHNKLRKKYHFFFVSNQNYQIGF